MMLHTGLQVNRAHLISVLLNFGLIGRALLANFLIVPLLGVLFVRVFHLNGEIATGVLLMAISPGVPFLVLAGGRKRGGSLGLAVELAFLLPLLSIVTVPITAHFVLPDQGALSTQSIVASLLLFQLVPLAIGIVVNERAPALAQRLIRPVGILMFVAIGGLCVLLGETLWRSITTVYGSYGMYAMACIIVTSGLIGWLCGGRERAHRRTLAAGTALRNIGLASVIAIGFHDKRVQAAVLTYFILQFVIISLVGFYFTKTADDGTAQAAR